MTEDDGDPADDAAGGATPSRGDDDLGGDALRDDLADLRERLAALEETESEDLDYLRDRIDELEADLDEFEDDVDDRTVHRDELESDLRRYVRRRVRRGHATGWGPYLVLLYGTVMTVAAFYFFTDIRAGWLAILAMVIIWLSTLGLYALMLLVGGAITLLGLPGKARDAPSVVSAVKKLKP
jgi:hypothetical protein